MSKSYWFGDEEQKGNFSNDKKDTFDPKKRYIGIRLQQGVPLLDRDWNELEDIRRYEEQMLRQWYIGNGTPDDGFKIMPLDEPGYDFKIKAGRCLVDGLEAVNDHKDILYSAQEDVDTGPDMIKKLDEFIVYLDVWIEEVRQDVDHALANEDDVKMETCVRHKLRWRVGIGNWDSKAHHHYYQLARIKKKKKDPITEKDIIDERRTGLALQYLRDGLDGLATNKMADSWHRHSKLVARDGSLDPALSVDNSGRVGIGTTAPSRILHVEGNEIHSGGNGAGFSFADRTKEKLVENPTNGERWLWYSKDGIARLWSGNDKLSVDKDGNLTTAGAIRGTLEGALKGNIRVKDTRNDNDLPGKFNQEVSFDFKDRSTVGVPGAGTYSGMITLAPWVADGTGGFHHQLNFNDGGIFWRTGQTAIALWRDRPVAEPATGIQPIAGIAGPALGPQPVIGIPHITFELWGNWQKIKTEETSDERFKSGIMPLTPVLDKLDRVRGISFEWNDLYKSLGYPNNGGRREIGLIAQEVEAAFPELVTSHGAEKYRVLNYERLTAVLVEAIKELRAEVETLKRKINS